MQKFKILLESKIPLLTVIIILALIGIIVALILHDKKIKEQNNTLIEFLNNSYLRFGALEQSLYILLDPKRDIEQIEFLEEAFSDLYEDPEDLEDYEIEPKEYVEEQELIYKNNQKIQSDLSEENKIYDENQYTA